LKSNQKEVFKVGKNTKQTTEKNQGNKRRRLKEIERGGKKEEEETKRLLFQFESFLERSSNIKEVVLFFSLFLSFSFSFWLSLSSLPVITVCPVFSRFQHTRTHTQTDDVCVLTSL